MDDDYVDTFANLFVDDPEIEGVLFNDEEEQVN